jgi:hypothetical protein
MTMNKRIVRFYGIMMLLAAAWLWAVITPISQAQDETPPTPDGVQFNGLPEQTPQPTPDEVQSTALPDETPQTAEQVIAGEMPDVPPGMMLVEGDILIDIEDYPLRYPDPASDVYTPQGAYQTNFWIDNGVPVEFDANVTAVNRNYARLAMKWWEDTTGIDFVECAGQNCSAIVNDWVHITASTSTNSSPVGMKGGKQVMFIFDWNPGVIAHELGHTLGLEHEQSRADRDGYVEINPLNICNKTDEYCGKCFINGERVDCDFNFDIQPGATIYTPYDFDSIMHYGAKEASRNGKDTITVLPPYYTIWQKAIGQRNHLSSGDINTVGCIYRRPNWRWVDNTPQAASGGGYCRSPFTNLATGLADTPVNGMLWIEPGLYTNVQTLDKAMTLKSPNGSVLLQGN